MTSPLLDQRWTALTPKRREALLDEYRDINTHDNWWEGVEEQLKDSLDDIGFEMDKMFFSGFWSQGDGASFTGYVSNWDKFLAHVGGQDPRINVIAKGEHEFRGWFFKLRSNDSRYSHENCVSADAEFFTDNNFDPEVDPLRHASYAMLLDSLEQNGNVGLDNLEALYLETLRKLMRKLYKDLEKEHEHLTSEEEVVTYLLEHEDDLLTDPDAEDEDLGELSLAL